MVVVGLFPSGVASSIGRRQHPLRRFFPAFPCSPKVVLIIAVLLGERTRKAVLLPLPFPLPVALRCPFLTLLVRMRVAVERTSLSGGPAWER